MRLIVLLALGFAAVSAVPSQQQKIVGGSETTIDQHPSTAALLYTSNYVLYEHACGGIIINARSILTTANCVAGDAANRWRIRVGSSYANSGGVVHNVQSIFVHHSYYTWTSDNDIAMMRTVSVISYSNSVQAARIAGSNYNVRDNEIVWSTGWGHTSGTHSERLRHVQIWIINQEICKERYASIGQGITGNMLCAGHLDVGGRGHCQLDHGGPLYHNGVVVGVSSWGEQCGHAEYPSVYARVSRFTTWIQAYA